MLFSVVVLGLVGLFLIIIELNVLLFWFYCFTYLIIFLSKAKLVTVTHISMNLPRDEKELVVVNYIFDGNYCGKGDTLPWSAGGKGLDCLRSHCSHPQPRESEQ